MILIEKKELKPRSFTPFEITIRISNEQDCIELQEEIKELEYSVREYWYKCNRKYTAINGVLSEIRKHIK